MPLIMKKTINGQPVKIRLTADTGSGNPVGTILPLYKKSNPIGYLYCDGSTFDETVYPALYAYLGTNVLPDYREFALVGAEQNTTDVYDASTNPNGTIHDHDVYTEGQAKDDQMQIHRHSNPCDNVGGGSNDNASVRGSSLISGSVFGYPNDNPLISGNGRVGTTTRGKRKAVFFYIKATSGVMEDNTENFINVINAERSYSTSEVNTGKKWIDGKDIYSKTMPILSPVIHDEWSLAGYQNASALFGSNVDTLINTLIVGELVMPAIADKSQGLYTRAFNVTTGYITLEYTKTT